MNEVAPEMAKNIASLAIILVLLAIIQHREEAHRSQGEQWLKVAQLELHDRVSKIDIQTKKSEERTLRIATALQAQGLWDLKAPVQPWRSTGQLRRR